LSIVAEDERLYLPTALTFARIMQSLSKLSYLRILEWSINGGRAGTLGLLKIVEPAPGKPVSQCGLRLSADELAGLLAGGNGVMVKLLRHRQTKGAATDRLYLRPPRHISTLPNPVLHQALI